MGQIYAIKNVESDKRYIGSTINPKIRKKQHFSDLRCNRHYNTYLQKSFNKYGENKFEWNVLEEVEDSELADKEMFWINYWSSCDKKYGYNQTNQPYAPMRGKKHKPETIAKYSNGSRAGELHVNAKINESIVREIFDLYQNGNSQIEIGSIFDIDSTSVSLILHGKSWKHMNLKIENRSNNSSGCVGVYFHKSGKWIAEIIKNKKYYRIGSFDNYEDAVSARKKAEGGVLSDTK